MACRIHITGASGSGTSTLGRALAEKLACPFFDTDDFFWEKTDPPFQVRTEVETRLANMRSMLETTDNWVLSGSLDGWGDPLIPLFDVVVFISLDANIRMKRIEQREVDRFGDRVLAGGDMYEIHKAFLGWAAEYDSGTLSGRSLKRHEAWLAHLPCPIIRISSNQAVEDMVKDVLASDALTNRTEIRSVPS